MIHTPSDIHQLSELGGLSGLTIGPGTREAGQYIYEVRTEAHTSGESEEPTRPTVSPPREVLISREQLQAWHEAGYTAGLAEAGPSHDPAVRGRILRIVEYNTGGPQPEYLSERALLTTASANGSLDPEAVHEATAQLVREGYLEEQVGEGYAVAAGLDPGPEGSMGDFPGRRLSED